MGESTASYIMLSPESHDPKISLAAGRGTYTMEEMENWIPRALDAGVKGIMIWFFIGMPYQDRQSVMDTVAYSERLIRKFGGWSALPLICPMAPFLDPGCRFFEEPEQHGYRIFHRTLEEHRQAMVEPLWHRRLNYETRWLDRRQLQDVSYEAIARLVEIKGEYGVLPDDFCRAIPPHQPRHGSCSGKWNALSCSTGSCRPPTGGGAYLQPQDPCLLKRPDHSRQAPLRRPVVRRRHRAATDRSRITWRPLPSRRASSPAE